MQKLILFTLLLVCISAVHHDYVLYVFEREWAGSVCLTHKCKKDYIQHHRGDEFNVHGLWPSGKPGDEDYHMMNCEDYNYNQGEVSSELLGWMDRDYVGLYNPSKGFRAHEYEKHGSCYNYENSVKTNQERENAFFGKIKDLTEQYPLLSTLKDAGISPSASETYEFKDIESALQEAFNTQEHPSIGCAHKNGKQYLEVIQLCLDLDFNIRRCPRLRNSCSLKKPIYFPQFGYHADGFLGQEQY